MAKEKKEEPKRRRVITPLLIGSILIALLAIASDAYLLGRNLGISKVESAVSLEEREAMVDLSSQMTVDGEIDLAGEDVASDDVLENEGDYILPNSSDTYLTDADLAGLSAEELRLARNEIYARHGRIFDDPELQDYFNSKDWYTGTISSDDFKESMLSALEKDNIDLIKAYEELAN